MQDEKEARRVSKHSGTRVSSSASDMRRERIDGFGADGARPSEKKSTADLGADKYKIKNKDNEESSRAEERKTEEKPRTEQKNDDRREPRHVAPKRPYKPVGDPERFLHQAVPYAMFWVALFAAVSFVLRDLCQMGDSAGAFGNAIAGFLCGLLGVTAYLLPLFLVVLALRWKHFVETGLLARKLVLSGAFLWLLSGIIHVFQDGEGRSLRVRDLGLLYREGSMRLGGGFFGGMLGEWMGSYLRLIGTCLLAIPLVLIVAIYLVGLTPSGLWQRVSCKYKLWSERFKKQPALLPNGNPKKQLAAGTTPKKETAKLEKAEEKDTSWCEPKPLERTGDGVQYEFGEEALRFKREEKKKPDKVEQTEKEKAKEPIKKADPADVRAAFGDNIIDIPEDEYELPQPPPSASAASILQKAGYSTNREENVENALRQVLREEGKVEDTRPKGDAYSPFCLPRQPELIREPKKVDNAGRIVICATPAAQQPATPAAQPAAKPAAPNFTVTPAAQQPAISAAQQSTAPAVQPAAKPAAPTFVATPAAQPAAKPAASTFVVTPAAQQPATPAAQPAAKPAASTFVATPAAQQPATPAAQPAAKPAAPNFVVTPAVQQPATPAAQSTAPAVQPVAKPTAPTFVASPAVQQPATPVAQPIAPAKQEPASGITFTREPVVTEPITQPVVTQSATQPAAAQPLVQPIVIKPVVVQTEEPRPAPTATEVKATVTPVRDATATPVRDFGFSFESFDPSPATPQSGKSPSDEKPIKENDSWNDFDLKELAGEEDAEEEFGNIREAYERTSKSKPAKAAASGVSATVERVTETARETEELYKNFVMPTLTLLSEDKQQKDIDHTEEIEEKKSVLRATLRSFNVRIKEDVQCSRGPTITRYEVCPEAGVRVNSISKCAEDISLYMAAPVRIEAPIPGKSAVGIEVPNATREMVYMRTLMESEQFSRATKPLEVPLGIALDGSVVICNLAEMPHLLVAGTTGSGKSVCINTILIALLYKTTPRDLRLILIDPKQVEFAFYEHEPHLYLPIVTDMKRAVGVLACAVAEMERRYSLMRDVGVRQIDAYNKAVQNDPEREHLPYMVIVVDEFADLKMSVTNNDLENFCQRIAQKGRACGIHLILGTQRPSAEVITGVLRMNIPSRIGFAVQKRVDSQIILDIGGAETLTGKGDMLYKPLGASKPIRAQGAYISDAELEAVISYVKDHNDPVRYNKAFMEQLEIEMAKAEAAGKRGGEGDDMDDGEGNGGDSLFRRVVRLTVETQRISTSLLQRRFSIGYGRAAKIIDRMEELGIVGPAIGTKPREVLMKPEQYAAQWVNGEDEEDL